jgi:hypothetical protein
MIAMYLIACIPFVIGGILYWCSNKIHWAEWLVASIVAFITAALFHVFSIMGMTSDVEVLSGRVVNIEHHPEWVERWIEHHSETYTTGSGKNERTHTRYWTTTEYDTHSEHWVADLDYGHNRQNSVNISVARYNEIKGLFGNKVDISGTQSYDHGGTFYSGDNRIYLTRNMTGYIYPCVMSKTFENRVKACPSVFSYISVPTNIPVHKYPIPEGDGWFGNAERIFTSERLLGTAKSMINERAFDQMNSVLGPTKKVNVILIGFSSPDDMIAKYQEAEFIGGRKNDLVICYNARGRGQKASWAVVFGWTDKMLVKRNLETIFLNNPIDDSILPLMAKEIETNYVIKNWERDFAYLSVEAPTWAYVVLILVMILTQTALWWIFMKNDFDQDSPLLENGGYRRNGNIGINLPNNSLDFRRRF